MEFLKYFITEDIYIIPDGKQPELMQPEAPIEQLVSYKLTIISDVPTPEEEKLLQGILVAIKISKDSIQHLSSTEEVAGENIIAFGEYPEFSNYEAFKRVEHNNSSLLVSPKLSELISDVEKKKKLWASLKQMFGV